MIENLGKSEIPEKKNLSIFIYRKIGYFVIVDYSPQRFCASQFFINDTHREEAPSKKAPTLSKIMNTDIRVVGTSNQLFIQGS